MTERSNRQELVSCLISGRYAAVGDLADFPDASDEHPWRVDKSTIDGASISRHYPAMKQNPESPPSPSGPRRPRQIIGFSLPPDLAFEVKMEAARRKISLRRLFVELWAHYKKKSLH